MTTTQEDPMAHSDKNPSESQESGDPLRGRFAGGIHPALDVINRSLPDDRRLWAEDIAGSVAHAQMLGKTGILPANAVKTLLAGLEQVRQEFADGSFQEQPTDEDIHMAVERRLTELVGEDGKRLHTGRSRNDQVATDVVLHLARASDSLRAGVREVQRALLDLAQKDGHAVLPYYTHLQRAQPILLGHALLAYIEMLGQDDEGLRVTLKDCPLGAGAGTGTSFPIDRQMTAEALGFQRPAPNSIAAVSSRREATLFAANIATCATTLSRLGGELVLWTSREFGFARLGDAVSTGSSIMPQKRNPDGAELLRAKAARVSSAVHRLLELPRGLPLGYHKDLQEDKAALFEAEDTLAQMCAVAEAMLRDLAINHEAMRAAVDDPSGFLLATEAADWLVGQGVPFREAHEAVGALVSLAERKQVGLSDLSLEELQAIHAAFDERVSLVLQVDGALEARQAIGGTSPDNVRRELERWAQALHERSSAG